MYLRDVHNKPLKISTNYRPVYTGEAELTDFIKDNEIEIVALTIPKEAARQIAKVVADAGVKAIWNFAHTDLNLPDDVIVENLPDVRLCLPGHISEDSAVHGNFPGVHYSKTGSPHAFVDDFREKGVIPRIFWGEHHSDSISSLFRDGNPVKQDEFVWNLDHYAGTVTCL